MANILQDRRELTKLSTAIKNYCGIGINEQLTIRQMADCLNSTSVNSSMGANTVNQVETITYLERGDQGALEAVEDLTYLANVIRNKAGVSQKLAVPQMTHLVTNFRKAQYFYTQAILNYYGDYSYSSTDYSMEFSWNNDVFNPLTWNCGSSYTDYYHQGISISTEYVDPGNSGNIYFTFDSKYTYDSPLYVYLYRSRTLINKLTLTINNATCSASVSVEYYEPDDDNSGGDCGGSCGGDFDCTYWGSFNETYQVSAGRGTGIGEVTVTLGGQSLKLDSVNQQSGSIYFDICRDALVSVEFTEPSMPESEWQAKISITVYGAQGDSYSLSITSTTDNYSGTFYCS